MDMDRRDRDGIRIDLQSSDEEIRRLAVERLVALPPNEAIPQILDCLGDPSWRVRKAAVERLSEAPDVWPVADALIAALADGENPGRRNSAMEALVRCGSRVLESLIEATRTEDVDVRKLTVDTLAGIGDERCTERLLEMLDDPDTNVRAAVADGLGSLGGDGAAAALLEVATRTGDDRLVAFSALRALARLEVPVTAQDLAPALDDALLRPAAFAVLGRCEEDEGAVDVLLKGFLNPSRTTCEAAMDALLRLVGRLDPDGADRLIERIRSAAAGADLSASLERMDRSNLATRLVLIQFFGLLRWEAAAIPILLAGKDEALAEVVLSTLQAMGGPAERAIDSSWTQLDGEARRLACAVLGGTGGPNGHARLLATLDEEEPELRAIAASALGRRRCADALGPIMRRLESTAAQESEPESDDELGALTEAVVNLTRGDEDEASALRDSTVDLVASRIEGAPESVRLALATVLGRIARPDDTDLVEWLMKDPSAGVRRAAVRALARLGCDHASEPLHLALADESPAVRVAAAHALGDSDAPHGIDDLQRLADDPDARVRAAAMAAIGGQLANAREEALADRGRALLVAAFDDEGPVVMAAVEALGAIGGSASAEVATRLLDRADPEIVRTALACIGAHGDRENLESAIPLIAHPHWAVRAEAIQVLAERRLAQAVPAILRRLETEQDDFVRDAILRALRRLEG